MTHSSSRRLLLLGGIAVLLAAFLAWRGLSGGGPETGDPDAPKFGSPEEAEQALDAGDAAVRLAAVDEVGRYHAYTAYARRAEKLMDKALRDPSPRVREAAVAALSKRCSNDQVPGVGARLGEIAVKDKSPAVRATATSALAGICAVEEMQAVLKALEDEDVGVRRTAKRAYMKLTGLYPKEYDPAGPPEARKAAVKKIHALWKRFGELITLRQKHRRARRAARDR